MHASAPPITRYQSQPPLLSCPGKVTHTGSPTHIGSQSLQCAAGQGQACQAASAPSAISSLRLCRHEPWIKPHVLFAPPCHALLLSAPVTACVMLVDSGTAWPLEGASASALITTTVHSTLPNPRNRSLPRLNLDRETDKSFGGQSRIHKPSPAQRFGSLEKLRS